MIAAGTVLMPKALSIFTLVVAVLLLVLFGLDLAAGTPFGGIGTFTDIAFLIVALILGYLGWTTWREQLQ